MDAIMISFVRSDAIYRKIMTAPAQKKNDIYRYEMMKPFEKYSESDLDRLQQILFYKEMGFSLKEIKGLLVAPVYTRQEALKHHLEILNLKKKHLDELIELVKETLSEKGKHSFSAFSNVEILELQQKYRDEIIERWDNTPEYNEYSSFFSKKSQKEQAIQWNDFLIYSQNFLERLAEYEMESPMLAAVQNIVREWQEYISEYFYNCSNEMLLNLGQLYEYDERFPLTPPTLVFIARNLILWFLQTSDGWQRKKRWLPPETHFSP